MIDHTHISEYSVNLQIGGAVLAIFGLALFFLAMHRRELRGRIQGLRKFIVTDRTRFGKRTEIMIQRIGLVLFLCGILVITIDALEKFPGAS